MFKLLLTIVGILLNYFTVGLVWTLYYLAVPFLFSSISRHIPQTLVFFVAIICFSPAIYFGLPWWYDVLLFQSLFLIYVRSAMFTDIWKGIKSTDEWLTITPEEKRETKNMVENTIENSSVFSGATFIAGILALVGTIGQLYYFYQHM